MKGSKRSLSRLTLDGCFIEMWWPRFCHKDSMSKISSKAKSAFLFFWNSLRSKKDKFGEIVEGVFSFSNAMLSSLFLFVDFVLGILGKVNTFLQQQMLSVWDAWCVIRSLKKHVLSIYQKLLQQPTSLTFLASLTKEQIRDFSFYLQQLATSIDIRFSCPSKSFDKRRKTTTNTNDTPVEQHGHNPFSQKCSLSEVFDFFSLQKQNEANANTSLMKRPELAIELSQMGEEIRHHPEWEICLNITDSTISSRVEFEVLREISVQDIFLHISKEKYPLLWKETVKMRTIIPTTVCCEQSFSVVKHSLHNNMKMKLLWRL